ncbi:hypothetical protein PhCBS80983_g01190 [Powellomyces hirtus]|uniref:GATA-type domain-containing protein n=1 Tax=Powellomyces hirtus TaxID=109895 RepID=A0A507EBZ6_9FUNG|nr:hypothetical protein PhCBS80983_g01190 [Powellomyces hirtus]
MPAIVLRVNSLDHESDFAPFARLNSSTEFAAAWKTCTKVKDTLENGSRLENLSWRLWHLHQVMVETKKMNYSQFKQISCKTTKKFGQQDSRVNKASLSPASQQKHLQKQLEKTIEQGYALAQQAAMLEQRGATMAEMDMERQLVKEIQAATAAIEGQQQQRELQQQLWTLDGMEMDAKTNANGVQPPAPTATLADYEMWMAELTVAAGLPPVDAEMLLSADDASLSMDLWSQEAFPSLDVNLTAPQPTATDIPVSAQNINTQQKCQTLAPQQQEHVQWSNFSSSTSVAPEAYPQQLQRHQQPQWTGPSVNNVAPTPTQTSSASSILSSSSAAGSAVSSSSLAAPTSSLLPPQYMPFAINDINAMNVAPQAYNTQTYIMGYQQYQPAPPAYVHYTAASTKPDQQPQQQQSQRQQPILPYELGSGASAYDLSGQQFGLGQANDLHRQQQQWLAKQLHQQPQQQQPTTPFQPAQLAPSVPLSTTPAAAAAAPVKALKAAAPKVPRRPSRLQTAPTPSAPKSKMQKQHKASHACGSASAYAGSGTGPTGNVCMNCEATSTPLWRRSDNDELLCNACGLYYKLHATHRPKTPLWRRDDAARTLCNACGLYVKLHGTNRPTSLRNDVVRKRVRAPEGHAAARKRKMEEL